RIADVGPCESLGADPNDHDRFALDRYRAAYHAEIAAVAAFPIWIREHRHRRGAWTVVVGREQPAGEWGQPECGVITAGHPRSGNALASIPRGDIKRGASEAKYSREDIGTAGESADGRISETVDAAHLDKLQLHKLAGVADRQRPQEESVDQAEDRRIGSYPKSQRQDGGRTECAVLPHRSGGVA